MTCSVVLNILSKNFCSCIIFRIHNCYYCKKSFIQWQSKELDRKRSSNQKTTRDYFEKAQISNRYNYAAWLTLLNCKRYCQQQTHERFHTHTHTRNITRCCYVETLPTFPPIHQGLSDTFINPSVCKLNNKSLWQQPEDC